MSSTISLRSTRAFGTQLRQGKRITSQGRQQFSCVARGPVVTKRGVAFKKVPEPEPEPESDPELGISVYSSIAAGLVANPIVLWSAWTLKNTGEGLPPGPGGALGAAEGVSYLVILGVIAWSLYTKVATGKGLPAGPAGLLGAVEGFSYLSLLAAILAFALKP